MKLTEDFAQRVAIRTIFVFIGFAILDMTFHIPFDFIDNIVIRIIISGILSVIIGFIVSKYWEKRMTIIKLLNGDNN